MYKYKCKKKKWNKQMIIKEKMYYTLKFDWIII